MDKLNCRFCFPKVCGRKLLFGTERLEPSAFGIMEPAVCDVAFEDIDVFVVPALAYDTEGYRLGYGGGYYDGLIAKRLPHQLFLGVAFDFQVVDKLPRDTWDVPVDVLITEGRVIYPASSWKI